MSHFHIVRTSPISDSFRVAQARGMFDYAQPETRREWDVDLPLDGRPWQIGLIVGPSGSGKTTIARECFPGMTFYEGAAWDENKAVLDGFAPKLSVKDVTGVLNAVGFSSVPAWFVPYRCLSNGQQFRASLARALLEHANGLIFDEFTSVVDRTVAKIGSAAVSKFIRRREGAKFVAVSCHYDIDEWLNPDWVYDTESGMFSWREHRRFPAITLDVWQCNRSLWSLFRQHHYLDHNLSNSAQCYVATLGDRPVAFCAVIHFPHPACATFKREHRVVVLPDFQGVGIGNRLSEFVAARYVADGYRYICTTSAPSMIWHRQKSPLWRLTRIGHTSAVGHSGIKGMNSTISHKRITAAFEYVGGSA